MPSFDFDGLSTHFRIKSRGNSSFFFFRKRAAARCGAEQRGALTVEVFLTFQVFLINANPPPLVYKGMFGGWVRQSRPRCPLTVRLTSRLSKVIDWLVLRPPRTLSAALEVRGRLLCKSASFCTVATPGEQCHPPPPPALPPPGFTLGKRRRRQLGLFCVASVVSIL